MSNFKINADRPDNNESLQHTESDDILYTIFGKHDWIDKEGFPRLHSDGFDPVYLHAKSSSDETRDRYYIKIGRHGKVFNPIGLYSEGTERKQLRHAGRPEWELKKVPKKAFDFYINFLRTKNIAWLRNSEREL